MAGIYIHIPFCRRICSYCDFYKSTLTGLIPDYIPAVCNELKQRKDYLQNESIDTIYFGGGTPSLLSSEQVGVILDQIIKTYPVSPVCEITLEANPDDLTTPYLRELAATPVNRLSIGIQSFNDNDLKMLNRRHNSYQAKLGVELARKTGFENISIDLIYGLPGMTTKEWQKNLNMVPEVEHVSAYHLTIEPGTNMFKKVSAGLLSIPPENESQSQFFALREFAFERKLVHYEISNFAREGLFSKHNTAYWQGKMYLGAGPSAHSYDHKTRQWNIADIKKYIENIRTGSLNYEKEELFPEDHFNEYLMVTLRTAWGADEEVILTRFGPKFYLHLQESVKPFLDSGHITLEGSYYKMTPHGWLISDHILSRLIFNNIK